MSTNITAAHKEAFEALASGRFGNFALFSCFVNGEPATAIVAVGMRRGCSGIRLRRGARLLLS